MVAALIGAGLCKGIYDANIFASLFDVVPPEDRGTAAGLMNTVGWTGGLRGARSSSASPPRRFGLGLPIASTAAVYLLVGLLAFRRSPGRSAAVDRAPDFRTCPCPERSHHRERLDSRSSSRTRPRYAWARRGDINAFFGLMLDNIGGMILMASLLVGGFGLPRTFVLTRMIPGTAVGVLVGDLIYTVMAFRLARRTGRTDVTAMPLGLDTPSTFGAVLFIIGPAYQAASSAGLEPESAAKHAWFMGIAMLLASGIFKICVCSHEWLGQTAGAAAGLLGSLTAIALVLISFLPLLDIAAQPVAGLVALGLMLATLTARWRVPAASFPGRWGLSLVGCLVYYGMQWLGWGQAAGRRGGIAPSWRFGPSLPMPVEDWWTWFQGSWREALGLSAGGDAAGAGDGRRRHRLHRECRRGRRRLSDRADHRGRRAWPRSSAGCSAG